MGEKKINRNSPASLLGWLIAPLAILLAFATSQITGFDLMDEEGTVGFGLLAVAAIAATLPRILRENNILSLGKTRTSLLFFAVFVLASFGVSSIAGPLVGLLFLVLSFVGHLYDKSLRHEEYTILTFAVIGFFFALAVAGMADTWAPIDFDLDGDAATYENFTNQNRVVAGFLFFSTLMVSILVGSIIAILQRGVIFASGSGSWMSYLPSTDSNNPIKSALPLLLALSVWAGAHIGSLVHFGISDEIVRLGLTVEEVSYGHIGFFWSLFTGIIACIVALFYAERWFTRAMILSSVWILYTAGLWQEHGLYTADWLEGTWGVVMWAAFTFFAFVGAFYLASHEKYGNWNIRSINDPSPARQWWSAHWVGIMVFSAFAVALCVRILWNVIPAMNATGTGGWDLTGGSDPWYMKRAVDYIIAHNAHFILDADRAYPLGDINPRPPLFTWSLALGGVLVAPFIGETPENAVWWGVAGLPAIYGALTVFPIFAMAKEHFGKGAGVIAAWLIALMPGHVSHSTFALADHDAFVLLFMALGFHYYLKAVKYGGSARLTPASSLSASYVKTAILAVIAERKAAVNYAILAGVCIGVVALGWKGFVYGPGILFLAFFTQVIFNLIYRKDSTILTVITIMMFATTFALVLPVYAHYQLGLIWDASGMQPLFFIFGFTLALGTIAVCFRDKPWLLVFGTAFSSAVGIALVLWILQFINLYSGWDILTTGGYYFTKNKIFGTIAEAQAPNRGTLFASFGPIVFVLALGSATFGLWNGIRNNKGPQLILGLWLLVAAYMAWSAGRFVFNATPAMAVLGAWAIAMIWDLSGVAKFKETWRRNGLRTPADRFKSARKALWKTPAFGAVFLVMLLLMSQHVTYGLDAGIPRGSDAAADIDAEFHNIAPDILRYDIWDMSILDHEDYDPATGNMWYLGSFGPGFNSYGWNVAYDWMANQDTDQAFGERPAFVSWWDYGFQALAQGQHPTVSDNFQSGIPASGNMLLSRSQADTIALFIWQLSDGDQTYNNNRVGEYELTERFTNDLSKYLNAEQLAEFEEIAISMDSSIVVDRSFSVEVSNQDAVLAKGQHLVNGIHDEDAPVVWQIYQNQELVACSGSDYDCDGSAYVNEDDARRIFESPTFIRTADENVDGTTHYIIDDYWYTSDIVDEFESVSTNLHRKNARLALTRNLLTSILSEQQLVDLYADLMDNEMYQVQNSEGLPGEVLTRNHEIRYFAVDNRLFPVGGHYTQDRHYNYGNPTGIFHAPTGLSGQDLDHFVDTVYMTERGSFSDEMTADQYDVEQVSDFMAQQAGADFDPIRLIDVRVDHQSAFYDTMVARTYVGYGASSLGLVSGSSNPSPAQHFGQTGTPGSILSQAVPLPAAMMNHFVIANWYGAGLPEEANFPTESADQRSIQYANTMVKILKYYTGTEVCGQVEMSDSGEGMDGTRILVERDAFSGEDAVDMDNNTYWIPIAAVDADENGDWCVTVPAGHIRFSAYVGDSNPEVDRDIIRTSDYGGSLGDLLLVDNTARETNPFTGLLGEVSNMTWLTESHLNITGVQGHSGEAYPTPVSLEVEASGVSGIIAWSGHEDFNGEPLVDTTFILRNIWSDTDNRTVMTTNGSFTTDETRIVQGTGQVTFTESGDFTSDGIAIARNFTGNFTRTFSDKQSYTGNGTWTGTGTLDMVWMDAENVLACNGTGDNQTMPEEESVCLQDDGEYFLDGTMTAYGRFTTQGSVSFTTQMESQTFEGNGIYEGTGTINGTGLFIGIGEFSGEMVEPGSFYVTGLMPGRYNMIAQLENGREVLLPDPVDVGLEPSFDLEMSIPGSIFMAEEIHDMEGELVSNTTFELQDLGLDDSEVVYITTDENGSFSHGPLPSGAYYYRFDIDSDGFYELNNTFYAVGDSENFTIDATIPTHHDVTVHIAGTVWNSSTGQFEVWENANQTVLFTESSFADLTVEATSDANGDLLVELPMGMWVATDLDDPTFILYSEFELIDGDLDLGEWNYTRSVNVTGQVNYPEDFSVAEQGLEINYLPAIGVGVEFRSGNIVITDVTDLNGSFEVSLPEGMIFDATTFSTTSFSTAGAHFTVVNEMDPLNLTLQLATNTIGYLTVYDNVTLYESSLPGWSVVEIKATDAEGISWYTDVSSDARFEFRLPDGEYVLSAEDSSLNISNLNITIDGEGGVDLNMIAQPGLTTVYFNVFLDTNDDLVFENGTAVSVDLKITPVLAGHGEQVNLTVSDYSEIGNLTLDLELGRYDVSVVEQDARDINATDYQTATVNPMIGLDIGLDNPEEATLIGLEPSWLLEATLLNSSGGPMANASIFLYNEGDSGFVLISSDENGTVAQYIAQGNYTVVLQAVDVNGVQEEFRGLISINENSTRRNVSWIAKQSTWLDIHLDESSTETNLSSYIITAVSQEGLGNVSLSSTNETGDMHVSLFPGEWTLFMNRTDLQTRWTIDEGEYNLNASQMLPNVNITMNVSAQRWVEIGGKVYWDLNGDDTPSYGEGIEEFNVTLLGNATSVNATIATDSEGVWRLFVPIEDTFNVTVEKEGFDTEWYGNETIEGFVVEAEHVSEDIMVSAGSVSASGNITHLFDDEDVLNQLEVWLFPQSGQERDAIQISPVFDNGSMTWSEDVEPGTWIIWAGLPEGERNNTAVDVGIGLLDASVATGGVVDIEVRDGGIVNMDSNWLDFNLAELNFGDTNTSDAPISDAPVIVSVDLGEGIQWDIPVNNEGQVSLLLPAGNVYFTTEFTTTQRGMEMNYSGGIGAEVAPQVDTPALLDATRRINHDVTFDLQSITNAIEITNETLAYDLAWESGSDEEYAEVLMNIEVTYSGNDAYDFFTVTPSAQNGMDSGDWIVEIKNSTGEWTESSTVELGIGDVPSNATLTANLEIRIQAPNASVSYALVDGHRVNVRLEAVNGQASELSVKVVLPQKYGIEWADAPESAGAGAGGEGTLDLIVGNNGNGDDSLLVEVDDSQLPEGWAISPLSTTITLAKDNDRLQTLVIHAPEGAASGEWPIGVTVTSEGGQVITHTAQIRLAKADLSIESHSWDGDSLFGVSNTVRITVANAGLLDANMVNISINSQEYGGVSDYFVQAVPAGQTVEFALTLDLAGATPGSANFDVTLSLDEEIDMEDTPEDYSFKVKLSSPTPESTSNTIFYILLAVFLGALALGFNSWRKTGRSKRF
ncbi:MAG: hypothetical protein HOE92_06725 [Euryarchaeota archaeon]|nr:hypothetical protein [Euryarchaeota archaeon]MBT4406604.1 hypothetical protein [Euryarchaeota archaeon]